MLKKIHYTFITFGILFFLCSANVQAALELELTQGSGNALPIAVVPFSGSAEDAATQNLYSVINNDLQNSGRFRLVETKGLENSNAQNPNYSIWQARKAENIVTGSVQNNAGKYQVAFQLHDVYGKTIIIAQSYAVTDAQIRKLAHKISDTIYEKLIGIPGIFSTKIAYVLVKKDRIGRPIRYSLQVSDADGNNPQSLLNSNQPLMSPTWSLDGKQIAYVSFENNRATIYAQNVMNGQRQVVTKFPGINGAPSWSKDGRKMALVLTKTGDPKIFVLDLENKQLKQVTTGWSLDTEPRWMPDGQNIIFTSNRSGGPQIYQVNVNTGETKRLTYQGSYNARASISADGKTLVMLHQDGDLFGIAVQDLSSGRLTKVTQSGYNESPTLAPNGYMIAYASNQNGRGILAEVSTDGRVKLTLPAKEGEVQEPAWGPFSQ